MFYQNRKFHFRVIYTAFLLLFTITVNSQHRQIDFQKLTIDNGLSQNTVLSIMQDKKGFMWFGTQDGLNRFDGYEFRVFRNDPSDKNTLSNNYVWDVFQDSEGIIWIATFGGGLNFFDPLTEKFGKYAAVPGDNNSLSSNRLFAIAEYPLGVIWAGSNDGLNRLEKSTGTINSFFNRHERNDELTGYFIGSVVSSEDGNIWFAGDSSLTRFNTKDNSFVQLTASPYGSGIDYSGAYNLSYLNKKLFFTCNQGVVSIDLLKNKDTLLLKIADLHFNSPITSFTSFLPDSEFHFWIGTTEGLVFVDILTGKKELYSHKADNPKSISYNLLVSLYRSSDKVLWAGTRMGLNAVYKTDPGFKSPVFNPDSENRRQQSTLSIIEDQNGVIWEGTSGGINLFERRNGVLTKLNVTIGNAGDNELYILSLKALKNGSILAGTRRKGLFEIKLSQNSTRYKAVISKVNLPGIDTENLSVHSIFQTRDGRIWLGTGGAGLIIYEQGNKIAKQYYRGEKNKVPSHSYIFSILEDSFGNIWLGTASGGLNLFDEVSGRFLYLQHDPSNEFSLSNNLVLSLFEDDKGSLWAGTSAGLNKFTLDLKENIMSHFSVDSGQKHDSLFIKYGIKNGFPNEVIYGIIQDENSEFWLSTNKGLVCFSNAAGTVIKSYDVSDGLLNNEYNQNAYFRSLTGEIFFGGSGGVNYFSPNELYPNLKGPQVEITGFRLYNERNEGLSIGKYGFILPGSISYLNELELEYFHKVLTFEFAALGYQNPEKNTYKYMLEGFDNDWVNAGNTRTATYTNLDAGEYTFRVIAANNDGVWNENGTSIILRVGPAPWLSWYAYTFYVLCFLFAGYGFIRYRVKAATRELVVKSRIEKAKTEERERFRKEASGDFHDEAGSKLTKINLYAELAKMNSGKDETVEEYLQKIEQNSKELSSGMRDFIWAMDPEKDTLFDTIMRLKDFGDDLFKARGINFTVSKVERRLSEIPFPMDARRAVTLIFKEAMNNCFKHASAKNVELSVNLSENIIEIILKDDGKGLSTSENISAERNAVKGYGLKNMKTRSDKCKAELSITGSEGHGTEICFKYRIQQMGN